MLAILAVNENGAIGYNDGRLIKHNKTDFKLFKELTMGNSVLMGRKTVDSLPKKLDSRNVVCLSKSIRYHEKADKVLSDHTFATDDMIVCGGAEIYDLFSEKIKTLVITEHLNSPEDKSSAVYIGGKLEKTLKTKGFDYFCVYSDDEIEVWLVSMKPETETEKVEYARTLNKILKALM